MKWKINSIAPLARSDKCVWLPPTWDRRVRFTLSLSLLFTPNLRMMYRLLLDERVIAYWLSGTNLVSAFCFGWWMCSIPEWSLIWKSLLIASVHRNWLRALLPNVRTHSTRSRSLIELDGISCMFDEWSTPVGSVKRRKFWFIAKAHYRWRPFQFNDS